MATTPSRLVQVFKVTNRAAQQTILQALLDGDFTALGTSSGRGEFVIVDCPDARSADMAQRLTSLLDGGAVLTHISQAPRPVTSAGGVA